MTVSTAVFPVAGLGSRFLPATKANPKEMLPIVDKPLIQYAVEEAVKAGITHMIFITSSSKRAIEDHFDNNFELEARLKEQNKTQLLDIVKDISPKGVKFSYVRQHQALGLGHAISCAEHVVGDNPFAVLLADDLIDDTTAPCLEAMVESYHQDSNSVIAVQQVPKEEVYKYGVVDTVDNNAHFASIKDMIEKPLPQEAPSNLVAIGRYIFEPAIFQYLAKTSFDQRGEIQLTDAIKAMLKTRTVNAYQYQGVRYDCGSKLGYLKASIELGLKHPEVGAQLKEYLDSSTISI